MSVFKTTLLCFFFYLTAVAAAADGPACGCLANSQDSVHTVAQRKIDPWFSPDKGQHLLGSMILTVGTGRACQRFAHTNGSQARVIGVTFTMSLGAGKEIWDYFHPGHDASWKDLAADAVGAVLGLVILNIK